MSPITEKMIHSTRRMLLAAEKPAGMFCALRGELVAQPVAWVTLTVSQFLQLTNPQVP